MKVNVNAIFLILHILTVVAMFYVIDAMKTHLSTRENVSKKERIPYIAAYFLAALSIGFCVHPFFPAFSKMIDADIIILLALIIVNSVLVFWFVLTCKDLDKDEPVLCRNKFLLVSEAVFFLSALMLTIVLTT